MDAPGRLVEVRGTRLHVDEHGPRSAPALLFVHGGPGQGAYDFVHHQAELLAAGVHLVALDQRGALFSDPLTDGDVVTETGTVADLEAVREALGLESWAVLGHSFGGRIALRYAATHPDRVSAALFENPVWDHSRAATTQVEAVLGLLQAAGADTRLAETLLAQELPISAGQRRELVDSLGEAQLPLWFHQPQHQRPLPSEELPETYGERGGAPAAQLLAHEQLDEPLTALLCELDVPSLLILGLYDCITDDDTVEVYNAVADLGEVAWFEESGHFCHVEQPLTYARTVLDFLARA